VLGAAAAVLLAVAARAVRGADAGARRVARESDPPVLP
jgi:hypothetical protein